MGWARSNILLILVRMILVRNSNCGMTMFSTRYMHEFHVFLKVIFSIPPSPYICWLFFEKTKIYQVKMWWILQGLNKNPGAYIR